MPHFIALARYADPTPRMAPVMVCVVLTGTPIVAASDRTRSAAVSTAKHRKARILNRILRALGKWGKLYVNARARIQGVAIGVLLERCIEIQRLEKLGEHLHHIALASSFKTGMAPLLVMKWKEIIDLIEAAMDAAEEVAHVIEGIVLENA